MTNRFAAKYDAPAEGAAPALPIEGAAAAPQGEPSQGGAAPPANRFAAKYDAPAEGAAPAVQPPPSTGNSFMDGVENFNRQFERMALGIQDKVLQGIGKLPGAEDGANRARNALATYNHMQERSAAEAAARSPKSAIAGSVLGAIGTGVAFGGASPAAAASLPAKMLAGAGVGAGLGYADYADTEGERVKKSIVGGLIGGAIPPVVSVAKAGFNALKGGETSGIIQKIFSPKEAALKDAAYRMGTAVDDSPEALAAAAAPAKSLGIDTLTPGQVAMGAVDDAGSKTSYTAGADQLRARELSLSGGDEAKRAMVMNDRESIGKTSKYVNDTVEAMAPTDAKGIQKEAFKKMNTEYVTPDGEITNDASNGGVLDIIKNNSVLANKWNEVKGASSNQIKDLPDNSIGQLHAMRASIDYDLKAASSTKLKAADKPLSRDVKQSLIEAKAELDGVLDKSDSFTSAMKLTKQIKIKEGYQELLAKAPNPAGTGSPTFDAVHKTLFGTPQKVSDFLKSVSDTGGDVEQTKNIIAVSGQLYKSTLGRVAKRLSNNDEGTFRAYGSAHGVISDVIDKLTTSRYNKAMLDLTLSGSKWQDEVAEVLVAKGSSQQKKWLTLIGKAAGIVKPAARTFGTGVGRATSLGAARISETKYGIQ